MKVKLAVYIQNCGDGSAHAFFFTNEELAEKYAEKDDERFCEDVYSINLEFDDAGNLISK